MEVVRNDPVGECEKRTVETAAAMGDSEMRFNARFY
jgi:hypothetical protein